MCLWPTARVDRLSAPRPHSRMVVLLCSDWPFLLSLFGDILTSYAIVGMLAFAFRRASAPALAALALVAYAAAFLLSSAKHKRSRSKVAAALSAATRTHWLFRTHAEGNPTRLAVHASYPRSSPYGRPACGTARHRDPAFPRDLRMMLVGMAAYRSGFLGGDEHAGFPRLAVAASPAAQFCVQPGLTSVGWRVRMPSPLTRSRPGRCRPPVMAFGYAALVIILARHRGLIAMRSLQSAARPSRITSAPASSPRFVFNVWPGLYASSPRRAWLLARCSGC